MRARFLVVIISVNLFGVGRGVGRRRNARKGTSGGANGSDTCEALNPTPDDRKITLKLLSQFIGILKYFRSACCISRRIEIAHLVVVVSAAHHRPIVLIIHFGHDDRSLTLAFLPYSVLLGGVYLITESGHD